MKIALVANSSWYLKNFRYNTIDCLSKKYVPLCFSPDRDVEISNVVQYEFTMDSSSTSFLKESKAILSLFSVIKSTSPDLIFSFNPKTNLYTLMACTLLKIPVVINISGVGSASKLKGVVGFVYNTMLRFFLKKATYIFFQNTSDHALYLSKGIANSVNSEVIPGSGVDLKKFTHDTSIPRSNKFIISCRLIKEKGVVEYLEAAHSLLSDYKYVQFELAGVNDYSKRSLAEETIQFYKKIPGLYFHGMRDDMERVLQGVDCVVLPSYYPEGTPRSLLEAAASGKVIITTDTPGCRDVVIEGVNGFLVPPRDTEALKEAMEKVINLSDEKLAEMQANSRKLAEEKYDEQYVIQRYLDVAEEILAKKSKK